MLWPSDDGFKFNTPTLGFDRMEKYISREQLDKATNYRKEKFERPQLLIQNGQPTHLYVAAGKNILRGDGSCSYVFKVNNQF